MTVNDGGKKSHIYSDFARVTSVTADETLPEVHLMDFSLVMYFIQQNKAYSLQKMLFVENVRAFSLPKVSALMDSHSNAAYS
jgi:hypothetical protein